MSLFSMSGLHAVAMESGKIWTGVGGRGRGGEVDAKAEIDLSKGHRPKILRQV